MLRSKLHSNMLKIRFHFVINLPSQSPAQKPSALPAVYHIELTCIETLMFSVSLLQVSHRYFDLDYIYL